MKKDTFRMIVRFAKSGGEICICLGLDEIINGIEIPVYDFANNSALLKKIGIVSLYAEDNNTQGKKDYAFEFMCVYLGQFARPNELQPDDVSNKLFNNETLQILAQGDLLSELKDLI